MHAGDGTSENDTVAREAYDERGKAVQVIAPDATAMVRLVDSNENVTPSYSTSASGSSGVIGSVGSGSSILRRRGKKKKDYPAAWGKPSDNMTLKKRILRVYDGPNQLLKEDVTFNTAYEVRMHIGNGKDHVSALDVETVNRAEVVHQYMTGNNFTATGGDAGWGTSGIEAFGSHVDVMKDKKRLLST